MSPVHELLIVFLLLLHFLHFVAELRIAEPEENSEACAESNEEYKREDVIDAVLVELFEQCLMLVMPKVTLNVHCSKLPVTNAPFLIAKLGLFLYSYCCNHKGRHD